MSTKIKGAKRSKTVWLGLAVSVLGVLQINLEVFNTFLTPAQQGLATLGVGVAIVVLRWVTETALDEK